MRRQTGTQISQTALQNFYEELAAGGTELHAIEIYEHGNCLLREAIRPYSCSAKRECYSLSKSFTATAVGIAYDQGLLSPNDLLSEYFPDEIKAQPDHRWRQMTLRQLLTMTTGHAVCPMPQMAFADDAVRAFFEAPMVFEPGEHFAYNTGTALMLAEVVRRAAGQSVPDFLDKYLFRPLEITDVSWEKPADGHIQGGTGLQVSCDDIAKLGQLYVQNGIWKGKRLLSEEWIRMAGSRQVKTSLNGAADYCAGYGFQFWQNAAEGFRGDGAFGQLCLILPQRDMAVAVLVESTDMQSEEDALRRLLEHLKDDSAGSGLPAIYRPSGSLDEETWDSGWLQCGPNPMDFIEMRAAKNNEKLTLFIKDSTQQCQQITAVPGKWTENHLRARHLKPLLYQQMPRAERADLHFMAAAAQEGDTLILDCRMLNSPHHFQLKMRRMNDGSITVNPESPVEVFGPDCEWRTVKQ